MLLYDSFTIALRYNVKLEFSQFAREIMETEVKDENIKVIF